MKRITLLAFIAATLISFCTGCSNRYVMRLTNGHSITTRSKPMLDEKKKVFRFKNADGEKTYLPAIRVREIEPL